MEVGQDASQEEKNVGLGITQRELTFGEKAVGLTFNPGGHEKVNEVKALYAKIIDLCQESREELKNREDSYPGETGEMARLYSVAITEAQTAQMWAVKAITWK